MKDDIKKWIIEPKKTNEIVEQILINRKIAKIDWPDFLKPEFSKLYDPYLLNDMEKAVERLQKAFENKETVGIFADYDADGIPAAALLSTILEDKLGLKTVTYIPTRSDGYGLNKNGIDYLRKSGATLLITADLGIREIENTEYAQKIGFDVIITDHHEPGGRLPKPFALINPKLKNSQYPFRELSGGGVIFKYIQALAKKFKQITENDLKWCLDLVSITTICDVVPLIGENRIFAKFGLFVLVKTKRIGLQELYKVANISIPKINTYSVGFQIGPRLNAPGRMNHANESFLLLTTKENSVARKLATDLDRINRTRQLKLDEILVETEKKIEIKKLYKNKVIILSSEKWSTGLIGLVAGKIVEKYNRPTLIFEKGIKFSKGSMRSIDNFNTVEMLEKAKSLIENFGGHAKAAGLTIKNENLKKLNKKLLEIADKYLTEEDLEIKINIDAEIKLDEIDLNLIRKLIYLEPFGLGNPRPVFIVKNIKIENQRLVGGDKHLSFKIKQASGRELRAVYFNQNKLLENQKPFDLVCYLEENVWNGKSYPQLKVIDAKLT